MHYSHRNQSIACDRFIVGVFDPTDHNGRVGSVIYDLPSSTHTRILLPLSSQAFSVAVNVL